MSKESKEWVNKQELSPLEMNTANNVIADVPGEFNEFSIKLEGLGNKHYVPKEKEKELIEWIKLSTSLFMEKVG